MTVPVTLLGIGQWLGQTRFGPNLAPDALRRAGLIKRLQALQIEIDDGGNVAIAANTHDGQQHSQFRNGKSIAAISNRIAKEVSAIIDRRRMPLILGGDHSISIGTIAGIAQHYDNLGVIWYDAHGDMNTIETTPSGNVHGMPLAAGMGLGHPALVNVGGYAGKVKAENIVLIGVRDLDEGEKQLIAQKQIKLYTAQDVKQLGMTRVIAEVIEYLKKTCDGIHLSFDLDGIDPREAPGVGTPVRGGVSFADSLLALKLLFASRCITSAEFVELNPLLDSEGQTVDATIALIGALFGEIIGRESCNLAVGRQNTFEGERMTPLVINCREVYNSGKV